MQFINLKTDRSMDDVISMITDNNRVNDGVRFDDRRGTPRMHVRVKENGVRMTCEMVGRPTKDNAFGFLVGTFFVGKIKEKNGVTTLKGIIMTAPIYHAIMIALVAFLVYKCIELGAFSPLIIFAVAFELIFFRDEFRKQGYISRYLNRAFRRLSQNQR